VFKGSRGARGERWESLQGKSQGGLTGHKKEPRRGAVQETSGVEGTQGAARKAVAEEGHEVRDLRG